MTTYPRYCPKCNTDFRGERIPQKYIDKGYYDPSEPYYYRVIGIYDQDKDRTVKWKCPDCGHKWERRDE